MTAHLTVPNTHLITLQEPERDTFLKRARRNRSFVFGLGWIVVVGLAALLLPIVLHLDPYSVSPSSRLQGPSSTHWFGTDGFGRDVFARVLSGALTSLKVGLIVCGVSAVVGTMIGVLAAFNTVLDQVLMRICDGLMAIPGILLAVSLAAALGPSTTNLIIALAVVYTPGLARVVRSRALAVKSDTFVDASRVQGARPVHVMVKHILPNTFSVTAVQATFIFAESVITEAALSFLGAGVPQPMASWGNMLNEGKDVIMQAPHIVIFTSIFLVMTVLALNLLGDGLRDIVDSRGATQRPKRLGVLGRMTKKNATPQAPSRAAQKGEQR
ncbi:ABC transporter permease [Leucobacter sp. UCMA 4100]|uniref:ABC transporter permease n=1 Tax=Leucobacter sp. UCMA 4100 TaxID=2810534 RepID=UPI0022EB7660|nr:ABC transporter permease [Leucobacter sp. UCMA 4100]MDA3146998.1 ABC transporter permease [Leucobacter sp. UCMA 4100]